MSPCIGPKVGVLPVRCAYFTVPEPVPVFVRQIAPTNERAVLGHLSKVQAGRGIRRRTG